MGYFKHCDDCEETMQAPTPEQIVNDGYYCINGHQNEIPAWSYAAFFGELLERIEKLEARQENK